MKRTICILISFAIGICAGLADCCVSASAADVGLRTVVIDAGHGGKDPGAVSRDGKTYEKDLTLDIALELAEAIRSSCPDVKVVLTRSKDVFVSLNDRAVAANRAGADLFISIHINSAENRAANGYSVHLMGQSSRKDKDLYEYNLNVCKRENSVIKLEDDYTTTYEGFDPDNPESVIFMQLMQNAHLEQSLDFAVLVEEKMQHGPIAADRGVWQNPFYVLWKTAMPSALVELGFISNTADLAVLRDKEKRKTIAGCLCDAFIIYKQHYDRTLGAGSDSASSGSSDSSNGSSETEKGSTSSASDSSGSSASAAVVPGPLYGVQIFAGANLISEDSPLFLGYPVRIIRTGKIYKYVIAAGTDRKKLEEDFSKIKNQYPDAFIVKLDN